MTFPFQHKKIKSAREGLLAQVEKFIDDERYGSLSKTNLSM